MLHEMMGKGGREGDLPNTTLHAFKFVNHICRVVQKIMRDRNAQFWVLDLERATREGDEGCDGRMLEALVEDFTADEAGGAGEENLHGGASGLCVRVCVCVYICVCMYVCVCVCVCMCG